MAENFRNRYDQHSPCCSCDPECCRVDGPYCPVRPLGLSAFGGLYHCEQELLTLEEGCMETVPLREPMASCNVELKPDSIVINDGGNYRIDFMAALEAAHCGMDATIAVFVNFCRLTPLTLRLELNEKPQYVSAFAIVPLECGDRLALVISSVSGGIVRLCPTLNASLSVMRLGNSICHT